MKRRLAMALATIALTVGMLPGVASAGGPNQGNADKVLTVRNYDVSCEYPKAGKKIEGGDLGRHLLVYSYSPIYKVTIKSGQDNYVGGYFFDYEKKAKIWSKKDISNYVVWTCPVYTT